VKTQSKKFKGASILVLLLSLVLTEAVGSNGSRSLASKESSEIMKSMSSLRLLASSETQKSVSSKRRDPFKVYQEVLRRYRMKGLKKSSWAIAMNEAPKSFYVSSV
jgi:hypothetical protein